MNSQGQSKSIQWASQPPLTAVDDQCSSANTSRPSIGSSNSRPQAGTHGKRVTLDISTSGTFSDPDHDLYVPIAEVECTQGAGHVRANEQSHTFNLSEPSTAPSTDSGSNYHTNTSSTSPPTSVSQGQDLDCDSCTVETRPTSGLIEAIELVEVDQGTYVAVTQEPGNEDKLQWRALSKRIHMAFAKTCRRYPNLAVQFKLGGASQDCLQPMILFVCPPETQKKVRKFLKKHKWLSEAECGYKSMILDGNFLRVALNGEAGLNGGLFVRADMVDVQTLCGKLGRLEGALNPPETGPRFTIGGILVVNDTLCCLTAGHVLFEGPDTSGMSSTDDEDETGSEEERQHLADSGRSQSPGRTTFDPENHMSDENTRERDHLSQEIRIGSLLTTSDWKRGVLSPNEDWSLIRLDEMCTCNTDEWLLNQFHDPGTDVQSSREITIDEMARTEAELTEAEVVVLAGCTGPQKGRLNTTGIQLYLDNAIFEAREITTQEPLRMGDSGSWVVQGSKLLGHVFAIQDKTRWSYMIPIAQVIDDIQRSLLTCSIELPTPANHGGVSSLCPEAGRSHASLVAFGVNICPSCKQRLGLFEYSPDNDTLPKDGFAEGQVSFYDDEHSQDKEALPKDDFARVRVSFDHDEHSDSSSNENYESSSHTGSNHSNMASTVPTSYMASTVPTSYMASTVPTSYMEDADDDGSSIDDTRTYVSVVPPSVKAAANVSRTRNRTLAKRSSSSSPNSTHLHSDSDSIVRPSSPLRQESREPKNKSRDKDRRQHLRTIIDRNRINYIPLSGTFVYSELNVTPLRGTREVPYVDLTAVLDKVQPPNRALEHRLLQGDITNIFDFGNPINHNVRTTRLALVTSSLNTAFRHIFPWYPAATDPLKSQIVLEEPYAVLVQNLPKLTAYAAELRGMNTAERSSPDTSETDRQSTFAAHRNYPRHEDVEALIYFTQRFIDAANVASESSRHERNACVFDNLWLLFQPGKTVYARDGVSRGLAAYIVSTIDYPNSILRPSYKRGQPYLVHLWRLHYDGRYVTRQSCSAKIDYFDGERDVSNLKVFPCEYLDKVDGGKARRKLEEQGRRWYQLLRGGAVHYSGRLPARPDPYYEGPVVIDRGGIDDSLLKLHDESLAPFNDEPCWVKERGKQWQDREKYERNPPNCPWACSGPFDPDLIEDLDLPDDHAEGKEHRYLVCAPYLPAFLIERKDRDWVDMEYCSPLKRDPRALDRLVQPDSTKDIIRMLFRDFKQASAPDLQSPERQKRSGNITILLHGTSGTGKRYTAECLAESEGKVLMTIHPEELADAGKPVNLLPMWLRLANIFGAIVLIPAADSYVEQVPIGVSGKNDVKSGSSLIHSIDCWRDLAGLQLVNADSSNIIAFWACLETYGGRVILTARHTAMFDEAALSRITLPIYYAPFDKGTRQEVGMRLLQSMEEENDFSEVRPEARELWKSTLGDVNWNGHEVKSVLRNALAVARNRPRIGHEESGVRVGNPTDESRSPVLHEDDLMVVVESRKRFDEYVRTSLHADPSSRSQ